MAVEPDRIRPDPSPPVPSGLLARVRHALWRTDAGVREPTEPVPSAGSVYLVPALALVVLAVALLELYYSNRPIPPGVDPGDWIQRSYGWVGLPHPPEDAVGSPFLYSPLMFPLLGGLVVVTGSPTMTGFIFGGALLTAYGLSLIHLARRYVITGPYQVLFVGLGILNGTTVQMLFWGGYPNFIGFVLFNEILILLLAFLKSGSTRDGLLFWGVASLLYLAHDLTFAIFVGTMGLLVVFLTLRDRKWLTLLVSRGNILGVVLLGAVVLTYTEVTKYLRITHPGYFTANPAAYVIDGIGGLFRVFGPAPVILPSGAVAILSPWVVVALLGCVVLLLLFVLSILKDRYGVLVDRRYWVASAWLSAVTLLPAAGYLAHVDTDYSRFAYFLPLPFLFLVVLVLEAIVAPWAARPASSEEVAEPPAPSLSRPTRTRAALIESAGVSIVLFLVLANVTLPTMALAERGDAAQAHDQAFIDACQWLKSNPQHGSILTIEGAVRWSEALTDRGAFDVGPTWLLFEPWQIVNAEESYWALNSRYAVTNNELALSFSGFNTSTLGQAPMFSAYYQGVLFPFLRLVPTSMNVTGSLNGSSGTFPLSALGTPQLKVVPGTLPSLVAAYGGRGIRVTITATVPSPGPALVDISATPAPGSTVTAMSVTLAAPQTAVALLRAGQSQGVTLNGAQFVWTMQGTLGQLGSQNETAIGQVSPAPSSSVVSPPNTGNSLAFGFSNPSPTSAFHIQLSLSSPGASNPAITLPPLIDTLQFFAQHDIHFLMLPSQGTFAPTMTYYQATYGYRTVFLNSGWVVLQG